MTKFGPLIGNEESVRANPKGKELEIITLSSGTVAFERTFNVKVSGFPDTVSVSVSTDTESGVEVTASAYEDFSLDPRGFGR